MVLNSSQKPDLIRATLATLHAFLSWVPLGYIFESNVIEVGGCTALCSFLLMWAGWPQWSDCIAMAWMGCMG
jgi:hypothetical protein